MTKADEVYAIFVAANPVPDLALRESDRVSTDRLLSDVAEGGKPMRDVTDLHQETDRPTEPPAQGGKDAWWQRPQVLVAAVFAAVLAVGFVWLLAVAGGDEVEPAAPPEDTSLATTVAPVPSTAAPITNAPPATSTPPETSAAPDPAAIESDAVEVAEQFLAAVNEGDLPTVMSLSFSSAADIADERMWGFNAVIAEYGHPIEVTECTASHLGGTQASVDCTTNLPGPLADALGAPPTVTTPFTYIAGQLAWEPFETGGFDVGELGRVPSEYLQQYHPVDYETACAPQAYDALSVVINNGMALTPECAEVIAPLLEDIAQWVRDGRP